MNFYRAIIPISLVVTGTLGTLTSVASASEGTVQGEVTSGWSLPSTSTDPYGAYSQLGSYTHSEFSLGRNWPNDKWSGQSSFYQTYDHDLGLANIRQRSLDIKRRLFSAAEDTFLAMGLGWNDVENPAGETSSGMRFVAEGRVGIHGTAYLFGQAAYSPWMSAIGNRIDPLGKELEFGLAVDPIPSMSFRAGYRNYWLNTGDSSDSSSIRRHTDGFYLGGGFHW